MCGVEFLTFNILIRSKVINSVHQCTLKIMLKPFFNNNIMFTIYVVTGHFEKQALKGLLKVIGIEKNVSI